MPNKHKSSTELGYEIRDLTPKPVIWSLGIIAVFILLSVFGVLWSFSMLNAIHPLTDTKPSSVAEQRPLPPLPHLQANPQLDLKKYLEESKQHMNSYGWMNKEEGIVHVAIEYAMKVTLERGLPVGYYPPAPSEEELQAAPEPPAP